jgi:hypothetical protein
LFRKLFKSRKGQVLAGVSTVILAAGVSFAAWTISGVSGSGAGKTGSLTAPTVTDGTVLLGDMFPSSPPLTYNATGTLTLTINNPNSGPLVLTGFTLDDNNISSNGDVQCDIASGPEPQFRDTYFFVAGQGSAAEVAPAAVYTGLTVPVPPGISQVNVPARLGLTSDAPSLCQNKPITGYTITNANFTTG